MANKTKPETRHTQAILLNNHHKEKEMTSMVNGWAFAAPQVREGYLKAYLEALDALGIERPTVTEDGVIEYTPEKSSKIYALRKIINHGYNSTTYKLAPECKGLTAMQKVLIADVGNACFGGRIYDDGLTVVVHTD